MSEITVRRILEVVRDFDEHGGASDELVAWELGLEASDVSAPWAEAIEQRLLREAEPIAPVRPDLEIAVDEPMWRLSPAGWSMLGVDPAADRLRKDTVARLGLLGTDNAPTFDALVRVSAALLGTQGSAVHIFDERYQNRIAAVNLPLGRGPAHDSFCRMAVDSEAAIFTEDATADERFSYSTYARGDAPLRFFAAAPLRAGSESAVIGTLCVFDFEPRPLTGEQQLRLADLAELANAQIELMRLRIEVHELKVTAEPEHAM